MQAIIGAIMAVSSFGAAYATQLIFPVKPIGEADLLLSQTTIGTVNILNKDSLQQQAKTPRELISFYLKRQANLQDVIEIVTGKSSIDGAYAELKTMDQTPEIQFLIKATEKNYNMGDNEKPQSSLVPSAPPVEPTSAPPPSAPPLSVGIGTPVVPSAPPPSAPPLSVGIGTPVVPSAPPSSAAPSSVGIGTPVVPSAPPSSVGIGVPVTTLNTPQPPPQPSSSWPPPNYRIPTLEEHLEQRFSN